MVGIPPESLHPRASPVLVGRADLVALLQRRWTAALAGTGHLLLIAGEAGIGKSRLIRELTTMAAGARILAASAYPSDAGSAGAVLLDLAGQLSRAGLPEAAATMRERLIADVTANRPQHRRLLIADLSDLIVDLVGERPTLVVLEDLHWADELSFDVLIRVAGRQPAAGGLLVASFRSDELYSGSPLARFRATLLDQRRAEEIRPGRLTPAEIVELADAIMDSPLSTAHRTALLERSDGIPLHIEELLAAQTPDAVPETVAEAVIARVGRLDPETRGLAAAASVIGRSFRRELVERVSGRNRDAVDDALDELRSRHLVVRTPQGEFAFRHALIRDAVYGDLATRQRRALHGAVAHAAQIEGFNHSYLSQHFELAELTTQAHTHALAAAAEAVAVSAHREAAELLQRARRTEPAEAALESRARLHAALAAELIAIDDNAAAERELVAAIELYRTADEIEAAIALSPDLASVRHLLGSPLPERAKLLSAALDDLGSSAGRNGVIAATADLVRARLLSALSAAYMLDRRLDESIEYGRAASALIGLESPELRTELDATVGAVEVFAGQDSVGWSRLESAIRIGSAASAEASTARAFRMMGTTASVVVDYPRARQAIDAGLAYTERVERWNDHHYLLGHLSHVLWAIGRWPEAKETAGRALADGRGGLTTRSIATTALGYLALGRGDRAGARALLDEAQRIGERMGELQRLSPPLWGLAELATAEGRLDDAIRLSARGLALSAEVEDAAYLFPFLVTGTRARLTADAIVDAERFFADASRIVERRGIPGTLPALDQAAGLILAARGPSESSVARLDAAIHGWTERERIWELIGAHLDIAPVLRGLRRVGEAERHASEAFGLASSVGAVDAMERARTLMARRAQSGSTPLSSRELEVAHLIADGATNRQIAERLVISPKTASSHVEHILAKLGLTRRAEVATWITRHGLTSGEPRAREA